jgi:predicted amidohydrolase
MARAAEQGARLVCFPEGTLTYPGKRQISRRAPELDDADWSRCEWQHLAVELDAVARTAAELGVWTFIGAPHRLGDDRRPRNSLHLIDPDGRFVGRYDKRMLSVTERTHMYEPGVEPVVFDVDGVRIGTVLCLETLFPELFIEYDDLGCDLTLIASAGDTNGNFARAGRTYELVTGMPVRIVVSGPASIELVDIEQRPPGPTYQQDARQRYRATRPS